MIGDRKELTNKLTKLLDYSHTLTKYISYTLYKYREKKIFKIL